MTSSHPSRQVSRIVVAVSGAVLLAAAAAAILIGPAALSPGAVFKEVLSHVPFVHIDSGLDPRQSAIVWELRVPRMVLAALVGATLSLAGGAYQGVFRNPLADPYLLGVAAGAGLGATVAIVSVGSGSALVPVAAFVGAIGAVAAAYSLGSAAGGQRSGATLILAGVAVAAFLTAAQTFVQQQNADSIREVYSWILGRLGTAGWSEVALMTPYAVVSVTVIMVHRRLLDVLSVGEEEARALGVRPERVRAAVVVAATVGTAGAVAVSGLIGFVGIVVPHVVRLMVGASYRAILPLSIVCGSAFLVIADLIARSALGPAEIPIGVITAFVGGPFFLVVLRTSRRGVM
ncbi:MAG: ABC transporter permease [Actinobacteria bacterium RBG_16_68_21]|nr:MAG: ABC transporter permease [Actinobacteria bacterium RBG_16_68_21]